MISDESFLKVVLRFLFSVFFFAFLITQQHSVQLDIVVEGMEELEPPPPPPPSPSA